MTSDEIRGKFLEFFKKRGHVIIPSASLIPENDPSVLFNTAGMQPLVPYLLGAKHPAGTRIVDVQKCVRTGDIDEVGDNTHLTFFEMLGNWSLGDYFKKEAIEWSYELLTSKTEGFGLDPQRLYVTCFEGDENAPRDEDSAAIWKSIFEKNGVTGNRIYFLPAKNNWWSPGDNGPCGPDTEMFYDTTGNLTHGMTHEEFLAADEQQQVVEIWNDVFMEYKKKEGKVIGKLDSKNVDTGSGLERVAVMLQGKTNVYDTDLFKPIMTKITELSHTSLDGDSQDSTLRSKRILADHIRTVVFMIADGVSSSNTDRGYILRRLIRRTLRRAKVLDIADESITDLAFVVVQNYKQFYPELERARATIQTELANEIEKFKKPLNWANQYRLDLEAAKQGIIKKIKNIPILSSPDVASGEYVYQNFQTYGVPIDLSQEIIKEVGFTFDQQAFDRKFREHQDTSRIGSEKKFKGGLGDTSEKSVQYHTATHLLNAALRKVLGTHVGQKGSNITPERLRFDFSHSEKMTDEQKKEVENLVNTWITAELPVSFEEMPKEEAEKIAIHAFGDKYGDTVKVYSIGPDASGNYISREFCGGPHVSNTKELKGTFKIQKEEAVSQGVRRIKAVLE